MHDYTLSLSLLLCFPVEPRHNIGNKSMQLKKLSVSTLANNPGKVLSEN